MTNRIKLLLLLVFFANVIFAQTAPPADAITIQQNLKKLGVLGSVLYVAAHPDDENTRLLAYLAQEKHYRTGYLSMTRGDGGQNLLGNEQGELLGLIRTQELLAARRVDGAEQFFTRANDFGFSKGPGETLKIWDKEKILSDVVWVIRNFRPDVIICRFPTTGEGGHGHHTSSAILAQEAFSAAADPNRFPEQLKYVKTWQAKRLLWNTFNFGGNNTTAPDQFKIDVGVYNPLIGKGYGEIAAESRSNHKTQGFGSARQKGESFEFFKTILGEAPKADLLEGVNTTWQRVNEQATIGKAVDDIKANFNSEAPYKSVPALVDLLNQVEKINDTYWQEQKAKELKDLIAACAGLWFESYTVAPTYAIGDSIEIRSNIINRFNDKIKLVSVSAGASTKSPNTETAIPANQLITINSGIIASKISQPYWLLNSHPIGFYTIDDPLVIGNPENPDQPVVDYLFNIEGKQLHYQRKLIYKYVDPVRGEVYQPLEVTPPVTANLDAKDYIFYNKNPQTVEIKLKAYTKASGSISLNAGLGWKVSPEKIDLSNKSKSDEWVATFTISPTDNQPKTTTLEAKLVVNNKPYSLAVQHINYNHVPNITLFPQASAKLIYLDLKLAGKKIGYIVGPGDFVPDALKQIGYEVNLLTENEILNTDLSTYDAIITGVRAYNVNDRLAVEQPKLLQYVKNGGNLVVQYNNYNGLVTKQIGPYPFRVVNQRVTDENAPITILDKDNPVLNYPNTITQDDFNGWVQERGLYYISEIDPQYKAILQMNDPNETPNNGALIVGDYGKGRFIYTSLAFFRQLPAGVPGAYRLFVNLLSKPKK
jgi:LmbE family N-acetylglucosaminyl deacetylase